MIRIITRNWSTLWEAGIECRRVKAAWVDYSTGALRDIIGTLSTKERLHLRHTVFRINGLLYLYARLQRTKHDTHLGVICGLITHLLDYFYDHYTPTVDEIDRIERIIRLRDVPLPNEPLHRALHDLSTTFWSLVPDPVAVGQILDKMLETQRESLLQSEPSRVLTRSEIEALTLAKGHRSLCLYFTIANPRFNPAEAAHLIPFGHYMQYMDDLEDFYEDQAEGRVSAVPSVAEGLRQARRLLKASEPHLAAYYNRPKYDYDLVRDMVQLYDSIIRITVQLRELTRHLPRTLQKGSFYGREVLGAAI